MHVYIGPCYSMLYHGVVYYAMLQIIVCDIML